MIPPVYSHTVKNVSERPGLACDPKDDRTRQEFKKDSDVNYLIKKYGANIPMGNVRFGVQEFGVDRFEALRRLETAQDTYDALPESVKAVYGDWETLLAAIADGSYKTPVAVEVSSTAEGVEPKAP